MSVCDGEWFKAARFGLLAGSLIFAEVGDALARQSTTHPVPLSAIESTATPTASPLRGLIAMSDDKSSTSISAEMKAAAALTTKVIAIGSWGPPRPRPRRGLQSCPPRPAIQWACS